MLNNISYPQTVCIHCTMKKSYEYSKLPTKHKNSACTHSAFQLNYDKNKCLDEYCIKELFNRLTLNPSKKFVHLWFNSNTTNSQFDGLTHLGGCGIVG